MNLNQTFFPFLQPDKEISLDDKSDFLPINENDAQEILESMYRDFGLKKAPPLPEIVYKKDEMLFVTEGYLHSGVLTRDPERDYKTIKLEVVSPAKNKQEELFTLAHEVGHYLNYWAMPREALDNFRYYRRGYNNLQEYERREFINFETIAELTSMYYFSKNKKNPYRFPRGVSEMNQIIWDRAKRLHRKRIKIKNLLDSL